MDRRSMQIVREAPLLPTSCLAERAAVQHVEIGMVERKKAWLLDSGLGKYRRRGEDNPTLGFLVRATSA